jgi:tRNA-2-methylthio-N6-dimethylallyladenosine synthase
VGFPGETAEDFDATLSIVREVGFVSSFGFKFSPRPHTPALKLADDVPEEEKARRLARLFELIDAQSRVHLATLVGTRQAVLFESAHEGRTDRNEIVHTEEPGPVGAVAEVEILRANKHSLAGRVPGGASQKKTPSRHLPLFRQV